MKLTIINEENLEYFDGIIGRWWAAREEGDMFVGLINDEDAACAAAVFYVTEVYVTLKYVVVDPAEQKKGRAVKLLTDSAALFAKAGAKAINAFIFLPQEEYEVCEDDSFCEKPQTDDLMDHAMLSMLDKSGFKFRRTPMLRSSFSMKDIRKQSFSAEIGDLKIKKAVELGRSEIESILMAEERYSNTLSYIDANVLLSASNTYGRFLTDGEKCIAFVHCVPFGTGALLDAIYAPDESLKLLPAVFDATAKAVLTSLGEGASLYIDTYGSKLLAFQKRLLSVSPVEILGSYSAELMLEDK